MATVGTGKYTYEVIQDWAKLPPGETFGQVSAVATDLQDRVYAIQRKDPPVVIFDRDGKFLSSWGNGAFLLGHGIHIADDIVYLTDRDSSVCLVYTLDGKPIQMLGLAWRGFRHGGERAGDLVPRAAGPFNYPAELVPGPDGDLFVADGYRNARVHRFAQDGQLRFSWGEPGKPSPDSSTCPIACWCTTAWSMSVIARTTASRCSTRMASSSRCGPISSSPWISRSTKKASSTSARGKPGLVSTHQCAEPRRHRARPFSLSLDWAWQLG